MDSQKNSQLVENRELYPITDIGGELNFIFKSSLFWRPTYLAQSAWLEHIPFAFWLVDTLRPRNIVELGTHYGSSYFSFCQAVSTLDLETCCFAVDTWGGDEHAGLYGEEVYRQVSEYNRQHYSGFSTLIRSTFDQALEHFSQGSIDLLHIDGLHTFEAVRHDFESWLPKLSERAVVIMHDTNVRERGFGVFQLLDELKRQYPHFEFAHGNGLGIVGVGCEQSPELNNLYKISENARATKQVRDIFYRLGKSCSESWENSQLKRQLVTQQDDIQAEQQLLVEQQALERGRLAERITAQHNSIVEMEKQLAHAQIQADDLSLAQQHINSLTSEVALLQEQLNEAQTNLSVWSQERIQANDELHSALHQLEQQQSRITSQEQARHQLEQQVNTLTLQLSEETQRASHLTLALSKSNSALIEHSRQISELQLQLEQALHVQNTQVRTLAERDNMVNLLQQQANALQQQLEEEQLVQQTLQQSIDEQTLALAAVSKQRDELTQLIEVHESEIASKSDVIAAQQAEYKQLTETLSALQQQLAVERTTHQQQISERDQALAERFSEMATLTRLLEERAQIITELEGEKQLLTTKLSGVEQQLRAEQASLQQAQATLLSTAKEKQQLDELKLVLNERYSEIATLTRWLEERDQELLSAESEQQQTNETYRAQQQAWQEEKETLIQELTLLQRQHSVLEDQVRELTTLNERLEANIAERFSEIATMTELNEQQSKELRNNEQQINRLKTRIINLKSTVSWRLTAPVRALAKPFKEVPNHSMSQIKIISESGYFDEEWYRRQYPELGATDSAIEHYLNIGTEKGYNPSPKFDTCWYLSMYPDVATAGINPLLHFIIHGENEGRQCRP
ncbi:class I SAM-dependent methyltransferase [Escherichia coli]|nr:class I SAM-dependent methyltransferase [Escherichia coli]